MNNKIQFTAIANAIKDIPLPKETVRKDSWVSWGADNKYPYYIWQLFLDSSVFNSAITTMQTYIMGDEVVNKTMFQGSVNRKGETLDELISKLVLDYCLYNGMSLQIIRNKLGEVAELNYIDFRKVRINEDEDTVWFCDWAAEGKKKTPVQYQRYVKGAAQPNSILYYKGSLSRTHYPVPTYIGAIKDIEITTQISNYHLNNILNNFTPSVVLNMNNGAGLSDSEMDEIEEKIYDKFSGTNNAGRILISYNNDSEHATTVERLNDDGLENKYQSLYDSTMKSIYQSMKINPVLLGYNNISTGFSGQEFSEAFKLYQKTVIEPAQKEVIDVMEKVLGEGCIEIKPFNIKFDEAVNNNQQTTIE